MVTHSLCAQAQPASDEMNTQEKQWSGYISSGVESQFMESGARTANSVIISEAELSYKNLSAGVTAQNPVKKQNNQFFDKYNLYSFYTWNVSEIISLDTGGTYYWYPKNGATPNRTREINLNLAFDYFLSPSIGYNYDTDLLQHEVVLGSEYTLSLEKMLPGLAFVPSMSIGYLHADDPDSNQVAGKTPDGYVYVESVNNLTYTFNNSWNVAVGPRFSTNNNGKNKNLGGHSSHVWWGATLTTEF